MNSQPPSDDSNSGITVLICEDEGLTALRLQRALRMMNYQVVGEARDGEEAVARARDLQPDVILMDVNMPRMDGIEATRRIMELRPTAIVMVTAYSDQELVQSALHAGASGYLVKPVQDDQIRPAISVALSRYNRFRELRTEVEDLKEALEARKVIERAKGILMRRRNLTEEEAYKQIQKVSRDRRLSLKEISQQIIAASELLG